MLRDNEPPHVTTQEEQVGKPADHAARRLPFERVAHDGCSVVDREFMNVPQPFERALNHFIDEAGRAVERGYPSDESLCDTKVAAFEGDEVSDLEQALRSARFNNTFGSESGGFGMGAYVPR